jgi:hypothetical protein
MLLKTIALALFSTLSLFADNVGAAAVNLKGHTMQDANAIPTSKRALPGVNCKGSVTCGGTNETMKLLQNDIDTIDDERLFIEGEHIACHKETIRSAHGVCHDDYTCAFLQHLPPGTNGLPGADLKPLIQELVDFGCVHCGRYVFGFCDTIRPHDVKET